MFYAVAAMLLLSGAAALIYQLSWARLLGLSMGSTSAAVATVLSAFFLGLAGGSYLAPRLLGRRRARLGHYALLELLIALCALLSLPLLLRLDALMAWLGFAPLWLKFSLSTLVLALPTLCIGATFPVIAAALLREPYPLARRLSQLYALNTLGAALGAGLCGFALIPYIGLDGAIYSACALNLIAAALAWRCGRGGAAAYDRARREPPAVSPAPADPPDRRSRERLLVVLFLSGFIAIAVEVGWSKYLAIFTGTTIYGFALILSAYLLGIALGAGAINLLLRRATPSHWWLALALLVTAAALLATRAGLGQLPVAFERLHALQDFAGLQFAAQYALVLLLLLPPTLLFGASFPLALALYCGDNSGARRGVGDAYAINTVGSIMGAVSAGFLFIPLFGTDVLLRLSAALFTLLPLLLLGSLGSRGKRLLTALGAVLLAGGVWQAPGLDYRDLIASVRYRFDSDAVAGRRPEFLFLREGKASVISLVSYGGPTARLQSNGIQESFVGLRGHEAGPRFETLLSLFPYLLHPQPESAFIVGFGGGTTAQAMALTPVERIEIAELEPAVIEAVLAAGAAQIQVLGDPRVSLAIDDARQRLLLAREAYDLIVSQPSHPWTAGAGNLFTRRFFEIVRSRLNQDGIYCQWLNLFNMDAYTLRSVFKAFFGVFPHGFVAADAASGDLFLLGSKTPLVFDAERIGARMRRPALGDRLAAFEIEQPADLLWYFSLSRSQALRAAGAIAPNTDTRLLTETRLARLNSDPQGAASPYQLLHQHDSFDVRPYLPDAQQEAILVRAVRYFSRYSQRRARLVLQQLQQLNPKLAQSLQGELTL